MERKAVVVNVPVEMHAAWTRDAKKAGVALAAYVRDCVEAQRAAPAPAAPARTSRTTPEKPVTTPANCTRRMRAGSWCRFCGSIHQKGF